MSENPGLSLQYSSPGPVASSFAKSKAYVRGLRGPVGSGKSVMCCIEMFRRACMQAPDERKVRSTRWAVIRNTNPQLKTTTIKTWRDWFGDEEWGKFNWSPPYTHMLRTALPDGTTVNMEVIFLALDRPEDVKKLLSLELTGAWINEAREVPKEIVDACTMRTGRFPSMRVGGPTWYGVIMDTNSPDEMHWWGIMSGEIPAPEYMTEEEKLMLVKPDDWEFFTQPPAMLEVLNDQNELAGYEINRGAENIQNLDPQYYTRTVQGKSRRWINVYVLNRYQSLLEGKSVFPAFKRETHVAKEPLKALPGLDILVGIDFGRTPSAIFCQVTPTGRWMVLKEVIATDMGAGRFSEVLHREIAKEGWGVSREWTDEENEDIQMRMQWKHPLQFYGDPAGAAKSQTDERTPFMILQQNGIDARPAPSNDIDLRIEAVEQLIDRMVDGVPALTVSPTCTNLIAGFDGGYQYKRFANSNRFDEKPNKNRFSHPHDALQYAVMGGGEGRRVLTGNRATRVRPGKARIGFNPLQNAGFRRVGKRFGT